VALGAALLNRTQFKIRGQLDASCATTSRAPQKHSLVSPQFVSPLIGGDGNRIPTPLSLPPLRLAIGGPVLRTNARALPTELPIGGRPGRLFTSPSSSISPPLLAAKPPTMERTSQYCGGQGAAPRCLPLGRPSCTLRCSISSVETSDRLAVPRDLQNVF